jgi:hypothetical protein
LSVVSEGGETHVAFSVDRVIQRPVGD